MATYSPLAIAIVSLATASFERDGFGIPIFITPHRATKDRVLIVTQDSYATELPLSSHAYAAANTAFEQPNGLPQLYIGRVEADLELTLDTPPAEFDSYTITLEVNDGDKVEVTYVAGATPTEDTVLAGIETAINAATEVVGHITTSITGTGAAAKLTISTILPTDYFLVSNVSNLVETYIATETAAEAYTAISQEDDSFYAVTTSDKSYAWLDAMSDVVNGYEKQFWTTVSDVSVLEALASPATDPIGMLQEGNPLRTVAGYHQDAETEFLELAPLAFNLVYPAGSIIFGNNLTNTSASRNGDGNLLTPTQKQNLLNRNAFFWDEQGKLIFLNSDVKTLSGERPENIRGKDNMEVDIVAAVSELLLNQNGKKLPFNNIGIAQVASVLDTVLQTYVQRGFIENNYVIKTPDARLIAGGIKATQKLDGITFTAQLTGAITMVDKITGTLQLDEVLQ